MRPLFASLLLLAAPAPAMAAPPAAAAKPEIDPQAKRITGSETYFPTFGLRASISRGFAVRGVLSVDAGLDIPTEKGRKRAEGLRPRLISSMRDAVLNYASLSYVEGEKPNADMLKLRLQKAVDGVLGKDEATVTLATVIVFSE
jgi:hypothetical protein